MPALGTFRSFRGLVALALALMLPGVPAPGQTPQREDVTFSILHLTTPGQSVYVLGSLPELGAGVPRDAVKLEPGAYPTWRATISLPKGRTYDFQYTWRLDHVTQWSNNSNHNPITPFEGAATGPSSPNPAHHTVLYHSGWNPPVLYWRVAGESGAFTPIVMEDAGPGRGAGERRWIARGAGPADRELEYYFTNGGAGRDPAAGSYRTPLVTFFVQEGQAYSYVPPPSVAAPQQINVSSFFSTNLGENRPFRVLLPRGYHQNPGRRYPVLYMHDGQNVFDQGPFGSWNADETAASLIRQGQMREIIIVGVENTANRIRDYTPPDDTVALGNGAGGPGRADDYAAFLIHELKPYIDGWLRTLPEREHTATLGSSMGGLVSLYLGWDFGHVFSRIGPMSGSWTLAPAFVQRVGLQPKRDLRIYLDSGDSGSATYDNAWPTMDLRDVLMRKGYVLERDLKHVVGYGHAHNEAAWAARLPVAYRYLFPATEEAIAIPLCGTQDFNGDGDFGTDQDIEAFFACLAGSCCAACCPCGQDFNADGDYGTDADIEAFFRVLAGGSC